jgi:hypothetical protein
LVSLDSIHLIRFIQNSDLFIMGTWNPDCNEKFVAVKVKRIVLSHKKCPHWR